MDCPTNLLSSSDYLGRQRWFNRRARGRTVERHNALISRVEQVACACVRVRGVAWRRRFCCSRPRSLDNKIGSRTRAITHEYSLVQNCEVSLQVHSRLQRWMLSGIISAISSSLMWRQPYITGLFGFNPSKSESWDFCLARSFGFEMIVDFLGELLRFGRRVYNAWSSY